MARKFILLFAFVLLLNVIAGARAKEPVDSISEKLNALIEGQDGLRVVSGVALAVTIDGKVVYQGAAGCAQIRNLETGKCAKPMRADTKVRVASISKMVLALALNDMVDDGLIDLDADVSDYLGWTLRNRHFAQEPITARMLLSHTGSIRDAEAYWAVAPAPFASLFQGEDKPFASPTDDHDASPGAYFAYANLNSGILASVMERAAKQRFDVIMAERVFAPLGLDAGYNWFGVSHAARRNGATLYRHDENAHWIPQKDDLAALRGTTGDFLIDKGNDPQAVLARYRPGDNASLFSPQGGLRASVLDLAVLVNAARNVTAMQEPVWQINSSQSNGKTEEGFFAAYGLGTQTVKGTPEFHPHAVFTGHPGEAYGLYSGAWNVSLGDSTDQKPMAISFVVTGTPTPPGVGRHPTFNAVEQVLMDAGMSAIAATITANHSDTSHRDDEPRPYDETRDAMADVDTVLERAALSGKKPLLVLGANWCHDSRGLAARFEQPIFKALIEEYYELLYVDVGQRDRNLDVGARFGVHGLIGTPTVLVLTPDGVLLNGPTVSKWRRAAAISDDETFDYFTAFATGIPWQEPLQKPSKK